MPVIPLDQLGRYTGAVDRLWTLPPGMVISAGQATSGKVTSLLGLVLKAQRSGQNVVLFTDQQDEFHPFEPIPSRWTIVKVEQSSKAWEEALKRYTGTDDLLVVAPLNRVNAKAALAAASEPRWVFVAVETALAGLDLSYVLRDMSITYKDFAESVRWVWSILLLNALCNHCASKVALDPAEADLLVPAHAIASVSVETGCPQCNYVGTDGRVGLSDITILLAEDREAIKAALVNGCEFMVSPELHISAQEEARFYLEEGVIGVNTYREAIQRNPLLRAQHALQVVRAQADKLAKSLWLDLDLLTSLANRTTTGMIVLEESGRVNFANALAKQFIDTPGDLAITHDHLHAKNPRVARLLADALCRAVQSEPRATRVPMASRGAQPANIFVTPLPPSRGFARDTRRLALLLIDQRGRRPGIPAEDDLRQLFDLTPAESKVALMLCAGLMAKEIARDLHLSVATVRSHLAAMLAKTGTARQSQLVSLLSSLTTSPGNVRS